MCNIYKYPVSIDTPKQYKTYHLVSQGQDSPQVELMVVEIENILEGWTKVFKDQDIVITFHSKPIHSWNTSVPSKILVHLILMLNMRVLHPKGLKFDHDILFQNNVDSMINNTYDSFQLLI